MLDYPFADFLNNLSFIPFAHAFDGVMPSSNVQNLWAKFPYLVGRIAKFDTELTNRFFIDLSEALNDHFLCLGFHQFNYRGNWECCNVVKPISGFMKRGTRS